MFVYMNTCVWDEICVEEIDIWYYSVDTMLILLSKNKTTTTIFWDKFEVTFIK